jgi:CO/xanthine dehydrogenase Mo-binding subunit
VRSQEAAREAAYRIDVSYDAETRASTFDSAGVQLEDITKKEKLPQSGDADAAFQSAEVKLGYDYATPARRHNRRINDSMTDAMGKPWSSRSPMACYDPAAERFGWSKRTAEPKSMRDGDWLVRYGCATAVYPTHVGPAAARVSLQANGQAHVQIAAHDLGTGAYTVIAQTAAERLGIPLGAVRIELGDSDLPPAPVAGGSNTTASSCSAVTCEAIGRRLSQAERQTVGRANADQESRPRRDRGGCRIPAARSWRR